MIPHAPLRINSPPQRVYVSFWLKTECLERSIAMTRVRKQGQKPNRSVAGQLQRFTRSTEHFNNKYVSTLPNVRTSTDRSAQPGSIVYPTSSSASSNNRSIGSAYREHATCGYADATEYYVHTGNKEVISRSFGYELPETRRRNQTDVEEIIETSEQTQIKNKVARVGEGPHYRTTEKAAGTITADAAA